MFGCVDALGPQAGDIARTAWLAAGLTLILWAAAFLTEIWRGCVESVAKGQWEASASLAMGRLQQMRYVILPQALYNMIPSLISTFVSTIKDTTLGYVINVPDLTFAANQVNNQLSL